MLLAMFASKKKEIKIVWFCYVVFNSRKFIGTPLFKVTAIQPLMFNALWIIQSLKDFDFHEADACFVLQSAIFQFLDRP
jgi:hypothetical protein